MTITLGATGRKICGLIAVIALLVSCSEIGGDAQSDAEAEGAGTETVFNTPGPFEVDTLDGTELSDFTGNAAFGREVFVQCSACHVTEPGINRIGPSLAGIMGRPAGSIPRFNYSAELRGSGIVWSPEKLNQYLENPQRVVPGSRETFAGLSSGQQRADVIAFLQTHGGR